ncbi:NOL1/NOP2/sun family putative RNA methylase [Paenibacillus phyllosphaerae]|uniref:NOL1/NOP2/sun family putative RNA methylase n=2 Tax=Paenibacillus phyllosphaerae TaxID=274593 RepID=A0A7W5AXK5_9BACL|nr:NOL1/NOP2/sun family putative RNA methylase [Paenibacillus phyllosphaerae]
MRASLPKSFINQMQHLLGHETERFLQSYDEPRTYGLRLNPLKYDQHEELLGELTSLFTLSPIRWCSNGYYYEESARPGKHPYHDAGLYYIQEPSAMTAAALLDPQPGEVILDLAAAPGGKTTQIAGAMKGQGLLIANEIHPARAKILSENVERFGIANAIVTNAAPDELSRRFPAFFDRIMLDAPCSGEGMFRKDEQAIAEWSPEHVAMCAARQTDILEHAAIMLKPGGRLVYSTCTFNRSENEEAIAAFCQQHPEFSVVETERVWPHLVRGEGHFVAVLRKSAEANDALPATSETRAKKSGKAKRSESKERPSSDMAFVQAFAAESLPGGLPIGPGETVRYGEALYWLPQGAGSSLIAAADLNGLKVPRPGLHLGDMKKNRFEPAHALALAISANHAAWVQSYAAEAPEVHAYLRGETLPAESGHTGWGIVAVNGLPLGWGKASGGIVKNHLPKGLRRFK